MKNICSQYLRFLPDLVRHVNCVDVWTVSETIIVSELELEEMLVIVELGKNSSPIVTGVSRHASTCSLASSSLIVLRTVSLITSFSIWSTRSSPGSGVAAGLGVEMLDICFFSCLNLWSLVSRVRMAEMLTASLSIVSRLSMMIIMLVQDRSNF